MTSATPDCLPNLPESIEADIVQGLSSEAPCTLPYRFISIQGPQALQALQGQVSCDLNTLKAGELSYGTANTPKGRIYALFRITPWQDGFLICLSSQLVEAFIAQIAKYLHFFKCELKQEQDMQAVVATSDNLNQFKDIVAQRPLYQGQISQGQLSELWLAKQSVNESTNYWPAYQCSQGIAELFPETLEHFILQQLNLQELGAVSFKKGCYTGQEIIARMKFLGKQKKKTYILHSASAVAAIDKYPAKSKLYDAEGKVIGELVRIHPFQSGEHAQTHYIGLGLIDISHAESGALAYLDANASSAVTIFATNYK